MSWLSDVFGSTKETQSQNTTSGTTSTQSNLWPQLQNFFNQYQAQFAQAPSANVPITPYQYSAANNQTGTTANLFPAYNAASDVATNGISPASISGYMSPYISNVVNATQADLNTQNARTLAGQQGSMAKAGALTGSQRAVGRALGEENLTRAQAPIIANLYNQGYGQAAQLASQNANARIAGAGTVGQLTNAQTNANTGLNNIGQGIWNAQYQNTMLPYQLTSQGAAGLSPFLQAAGQTGTTNQTGTSTGTQTSTNSPWNIGTNILGGALSFFKDGGRAGYAEGGSVMPRFEGAAEEPFHAKVEKAFHALQRMKHFAKGGPVMPRYEAVAAPGLLESFGRGAVEGATFGFDDKLGMDKERREASRKANPWMHFFGELVGGAAPMAAATLLPTGVGQAAAGARAAQLAARGAGLARNVLVPGEIATMGQAAFQGAKLGGIYGGLSGMGHADVKPEDSWGDALARRAEGALHGAGEGAVVGPVMGVLGHGVYRGAQHMGQLRAAANAETDIGTGALRTAANRLERDRITPDDLIKQIRAEFPDETATAPGGSAIPSYYDPNWNMVVDREPQESKFAGFKSWFGQQNPSSAQSRQPEADNSLSDQMTRLSAFMQSNAPRMGYKDGDAVWEPGSDVPTFAGSGADVFPAFAGASQPQQAMPAYEGTAPQRGGGWLDNFKDFINSRRGAIAGEDLTPMNRAGMIVAGMGIGPEGPGHVGDTVLGLQRNRQAEMQAQRDAARLGLERQQFEETQYRNRLPHFQQVGQNEDGLPIYGWVNPTQAPGAPQDTFRAGNGAYAAQRLPLPDLQQGVQGPAADGSPSQAVQKTPGVFAAPVYGQQEVDAQTTNLTGEAFLKYLEDHGQKPRADMIRAISEGRERFPESPRNATERALRRQVMQYDPTLTGQTYQVRAATLKDWNAGPTSRNITAINTAARHAADLYSAIDALGTKDRWGGPWVRGHLEELYKQDPEFGRRFNTFQNKKLALAEELSKAFHGGPSVSGVDEWKRNFMAADNPGALRASVASAVKLLEGRLEELDSNYFRAMNKAPDRPTLSTKAREEYDLIKQAANLNIPIAEMRERIKQESAAARRQPGGGAINGPAAGERVTKTQTDRLPQQQQQEPTGEFGTQTNPVYPKTPDEARRLPSGTYFYTPDGRLKVAP